jgi:hypothetical protein
LCKVGHGRTIGLDDCADVFKHLRCLSADIVFAD